MAQDEQPTEDAEKRDAVLRRMLATPKPTKTRGGSAITANTSTEPAVKPKTPAKREA